VPETNVEKSIRGTQNPGTFRRRLQRVPLLGTQGHSVILTSPSDLKEGLGCGVHRD